jgi:hypothetical protein
MGQIMYVGRLGLELLIALCIGRESSGCHCLYYYFLIIIIGHAKLNNKAGLKEAAFLVVAINKVKGSGVRIPSVPVFGVQIVFTSSVV